MEVRYEQLQRWENLGRIPSLLLYEVWRQAKPRKGEFTVGVFNPTGYPAHVYLDPKDDTVWVELHVTYYALPRTPARRVLHYFNAIEEMKTL